MLVSPACGSVEFSQLRLRCGSGGMRVIQVCPTSSTACLTVLRLATDSPIHVCMS